MISSAGRSTRKAPGATAAPTPDPPPEWDLRLYVLGESPQSVAALGNLRKLCEVHLPGRYAIEVIDLLQTPRLARDHQIVAIPTLVRQLPEPIRKIVGDLSDTGRTLVGLDLRPAAPTGSTRT
jgi:circadian clock protein KaiB